MFCPGAVVGWMDVSAPCFLLISARMRASFGLLDPLVALKMTGMASDGGVEAESGSFQDGELGHLGCFDLSPC
jgi:hypothetical protein